MLVGRRDIEVYEGRSAHWQLAADALPPGPNREACLALAEGYARLVELMEREAPAPKGPS